MGKVARLPDSLVNQIAAGEVVERPASVVKELCENSLDAGATSVRVELAEGGLGRIAVADDGCGMSPEDARLCLERHATSKLRSAEDLARIGTLGFRGEALPSIASVSRFALTTREPEALAAARIRVEGGTIVEAGEVGAPAGTQIVVEDLFFNTPARRKFAKRPETELGHCEEAVIRLALARPDVAFHVAHHGRTTFSSPAAADPRERIAQAISTEVFRHLVPVEHRRGEVALTGFVSSPDYSLSTTRALYTFINRRYVRDRGLMHAIGRAYAHVLPPGRQPAAVLFLALPLEAVDVNVHPQKLEVRFADGRTVYDAVVEAVKRALSTSPWLGKPVEAGGAGLRASSEPVRLGAAGAIERYQVRTGFSLPFPAAPGGPVPTWDPGRELSSVPMAAEPDPEGDGRPPGYFSSLRIIGQLARTYLVCEAAGGTLVLVDQHAAHERLRFDALRKQFASGPLKSQPFLFPLQLTLALPDARALLEHVAEVAALGIELEPFGGDTLALKAVPTLLAGVDYARLLTDLAHELAQVGRGQAAEEAMGHVLATMACHSAVRAHQTLSGEEARALLDGLDQIDFKTRCPHGRPVAAEMALSELERRVHRR